MQEPESGRKTVGKQHLLFGRETEAEGEQREKPHRQGERNKEFQVSGLCIQQGERGVVDLSTSQSIAEGKE